MRLPLRHAAVGMAALSLSAAAVLAPVSAEAGTPVSHPTIARWHATSTQGVGFTGTHLGATPNGRPLHLAIALAPRRQARMEAAMKAMYTPGSASYHHFLTPAQYRTRFAPTAVSVAQVTAYLRHMGLTRVHVAGNRLLVSADATVGSAERAFGTRIVSYRSGTHTFFANRTAARVPMALSHLVTSVSGLNNYRLHTSAKRVQPQAAGSPSLDGLYPSQFQTTYDAVGTPTGAGTSIAVLTEGDVSQVIPDLRYAEQQEGTAQVPASVIQVGATATDTAGLDEWDMDTQASTMMATTVNHLYLYNTTSLANADVISAVNQFVSDDKAQAMSASIGGCELFAAISGDEATLDTITQAGALQGQSLFASSGDAGYACSLVVNLGAPAGLPSTEWPASGTNTTAVGGTSLIADADGNRILEPAWIAGGGGTSLFEAPGSWTSGSDPLYAAGLRAVPDVALDADPETAPVKLFVNGAPALVGGTSLSSPLMLGVWARLESAHGNGLGFASPALYAAKTSFDDVVLGTNGLYPALPGYDYTTGLGTPDVKKLVAALG